MTFEINWIQALTYGGKRISDFLFFHFLRFEHHEKGRRMNYIN